MKDVCTHVILCTVCICIECVQVWMRVKSDIGIRRYNAFIGIRNKLSSSWKFCRKSEL